MEDTDHDRRHGRHRLIAGVVCLLAGGALISACLALARLPNLVEAPRAFLALFALAFLAYAAGACALGRVERRRGVAVMLFVAATCRLVLFPTLPSLSTDAYRYVWDARVAHAGVSPWAHPPAAPELAWLRDEAIYPQLNHPTWRSLYPPGAQALFRAVYALAPDSVVAMKVALALAELATLGVLLSLLAALGLPLTRAAIYAWNPLVLVEVWSSAHLDAVAILAVVLAVRLAVADRPVLAAALLGLGTLVKLYPAAVLPLLLGRRASPVVAVFVGVLLAGYLPAFVSGGDALGSLPRYVAEEYFNPGPLRALVDLPQLSALAAGAWGLWVAWRGRRAPIVSLMVPLVGGFVVLGPNLFPWYALWLVPFLALTPSLPWLAFTGTVALAYTFFLKEPWAIPPWARAAEFLPLAAGGGWALWRRFHNRVTTDASPLLGSARRQQ